MAKWKMAFYRRYHIKGVENLDNVIRKMGAAFDVPFSPSGYGDIITPQYEASGQIYIGRLGRSVSFHIAVEGSRADKTQTVKLYSTAKLSQLRRIGKIRGWFPFKPKAGRKRKKENGKS